MNEKNKITNNNRTNNLLFQTKTILDLKNNSSNNNINFENKKENNIIKYSSNIKIKNEKNKGEFLDVFLNYDYSRHTNKDKDNGQYYFKNKNKNTITHEADIIENKENKNISNFKDYESYSQKNKENNNIIKNTNFKFEEKVSNYNFIDNEINTKRKNINSNNKNKYFLELRNENRYYISNQKNSLNKYDILNNYNKYISNNSNKKKFVFQNYKNINNSLNEDYIYDHKNNIKEKYLDSLENSEDKDINQPSSHKKSKNKYHYNIKLTRNLQEQIFPKINNSYKNDNNQNNNSLIYLNYKEKEKEESNNSNSLYKTGFIKGENNQYNSCIIPKNDLFDLENDYNNKDNLNENNSNNCPSNRCPKCNCFNNCKIFEYKEGNDENFDNFYKNEINDIYSNEIISKRHSSLTKNIFKKDSNLNSDYSIQTYFLENNNNNNYIFKNRNKNNVNINYENKELNYSQSNSFFNLLLEFIKQDNSTEKIRQNLSVREDVNLIDLFKLFNHSSNTLINSQDISKTLKEFGLLLNNEDIKYLFRKYNKNLNEFLDYEEFCDIILPKKYSNAKIMSEKNSKENNYSVSEETKKIICSLFENIINGEKSNENYRKKIEINGKNSGLNLFNKIKKSYSVGIYKEDISKFMKKNKYKINISELELLMERFDKNKDGMIDYKEFLNEISPIK